MSAVRRRDRGQPWAVLFAADGLVLPAIGAGFLTACVVYVGFFYGDHAGKVCFIFDRSRLRFFGSRRTGTGYRPPAQRERPRRPLVRQHDTN